MWCENYRWNFDYARLAYDAGFTFENQKLQSNLDLAKLGLIDIETLIREKDVSTIERFIPFITQFSLDGEQKVLDPCFVKVFRISQLAVEYLLFCKKYLDNTVILLKKELSNNLQENKELKTTIQELKSDANHLRRKLKDIECTPLPEIATFRCEHCAKVFATNEYLQAHIKRRHELSATSAYQEETNKLQLEIKELKERLNTTEKLIIHEKDIDTTKDHSYNKLEELQQKFEILKTHVESELKLLRTQKEFQEKYEKLFEATITKTKAAFVEAENLRGKLENCGEGDLQSRKNSATQTFLQVHEIGIEASCDDLEKEQYESKEKREQYVDLEKMQKELAADTQQQINKVEGALEEMVATSLEKIQNQVQTALEKISLQATQPETKESPKKTSSTPVRTFSAEMVGENEREFITQPVFVSKTPQKSSKDLYSRVKHKEDIKQAVLKIEEIQKPVVRQIKSLTALANKESMADRKSKEMIELFAKQQAMHDESETETESETENVLKPKVHPISNVGQHSTPSMEKALSSEEAFSKLHSEIKELVEKRLKEIGISPDWPGLPQRSFYQALSVVNHQAELTRKKFPDFSKIRRNLVKQLTKTIKQGNKRKSPKKRLENDKIQAITINKQENSDSETESEEEHKIAPPVVNKSSYDSVIKEFKNRNQHKIETPSSSSSSDTIREEINGRGDIATVKSALRNDIQSTEKKKVAFLDKTPSGNPKANLKGGSTTSVASSVFDAPKLNLDNTKKEREKFDSDLSDWDISEILE